MSNIAAPALAAGLEELAPSYRALLCDVWGVVHNGIHAHAPATDALIRFRAAGGSVALITNAPRPKEAVVEQLDRLDVPRDAYDDLITSGEVARDILAARRGAKVYHVGPKRDLALYDDLPIELVGEPDCDIISVTGLFDDDKETPDDYQANLARWLARRLPLLCANPDIVVERGDRLVWCAGALAERYREGDGETIVVGKPHALIYRRALERLSAIAGTALAKSSVLAIGDGIDTDIRGAVARGIDVVFVTGGIHAKVFGRRDAPDIAAVHAFLATAGLGARCLLTHLVW